MRGDGGQKKRREPIDSERLEAHKKGKQHRIWRIIIVTMLFVVGIGLVVVAGYRIWGQQGEVLIETVVVPYKPTVTVVDENAGDMQGQLTARMSEYIGQVESDLRELGYIPTKVVIPNGAIREVDFYLEGYSGRVKMTIDRGAGVSTEDTDRMIRYLVGIGRGDFEYIDVRVEGKGYWK